MKKNLFIFLAFLLFTGCSDSDTVQNHTVVFKDLIPVDFDELTSDLKFEAKFQGDTLICEVLTLLIRKNDTIVDLASHTENGRLYINMNTSPNEYCSHDSCWVAHKILFDIYEIPTTIPSVMFNINNVERSPKEINFRY